MDIGIGLPNMVPGAGGAEMVEWAKRAEARGFSSLGTLDRILYESYEPLTALAAAAAVTERIGLLTAVLLGPLRTNAPLLAKQAQSRTGAVGWPFDVGGRARRARRRLRGERGGDRRAGPTIRPAALGADRGMARRRESGRPRAALPG